MTDKEKLKEVVRLAYGMYYAAQYMTTDASRLRRAMDAYRQFIITEYNKQEPALNRADIINSEQYKVSRASVDWYQSHQDADCLDGFEAGAQWKEAQMMKDAIECEVHQTEVEGIELDSVEICSDGLMLDNKKYKAGDKVKVIVIKE